MPISPGDVIQLIIAIIMGVSVIFYIFFSYWLIKTNTLLNKTQFFAQLCKEERQIRKDVEEYHFRISKTKNNKEKIELETRADRLLFDFYEYISILFFRRKIEDDMFYDYFNNVIMKPYLTFMNSSIFSGYQDRFNTYPNLSNLFNKVFNLSIKEIPKDLRDLLEVQKQQSF